MAHSGIKIEGLSFRYPDGTPALRELSLEIARGERVGIIGPNGAGKSTLLFTLNGIYSGEGRIEISGKEVNERNLKEIRRKVGLVFQDPVDQLFMPTVLEDVAFGPLNLGCEKAEAVRLSLEALKAVGMENARDKISHHLSHGEKKRVSVATVLSMSPDIIALDEPTSNLDPRARMELLDILSGLDKTVIIASHDLDFVMRLCGRTVLLDGGRIKAQGETRKILSEETLLERHGLLLPPAIEEAAK